MGDLECWNLTWILVYERLGKAVSWKNSPQSPHRAGNPRSLIDLFNDLSAMGIATCRIVLGQDLGMRHEDHALQGKEQEAALVCFCSQPLSALRRATMTSHISYSSFVPLFGVEGVSSCALFNSQVLSSAEEGTSASCATVSSTATASLASANLTAARREAGAARTGATCRELRRGAATGAEADASC